MRPYTEAELKRSIMIRVRTIYLMKKVGEPFYAKCVVFCTLFLTCLFFVDVLSVVSNAISSMRASGNIAYFFGSAFSQSMFLVKFILLALLVAGMMLAKEAVEKMSGATFSRV